MRRAVLLLALIAVGCGEARQDADEPAGEFRVEVVQASFPRVQHVGEAVELAIRVRNGEADEALRNVAVTVETKGPGDEAALAFGQNLRATGRSNPGRPVWVLAEGPAGGATAAVNTWSAGALGPSQEKELTWRLMPATAGRYEVSYRVAPGLTGKARAADGRTSGTFTVTIEDDPVPARVGEDGEVERGSGPAAASRGAAGESPP